MKGFNLLIGGILLALLPAASQAGIGTELNGMGSFGISLGGMNWLADADARTFDGDAHGEGGTAQPRLIGKAVFRYRLNTNWLIALESGFGWNSYPDSDDLVLWVIPTTVGLERRFRDISGFTTSFLFGAGVYVWGQRRHGEFLLDAVTQRDYHAADPGLFGGLVAETHIAAHVTFTGMVAAHYIYSAHKDDFKDRLGGDDVFAEMRLGVNYYFSPYEGLISGRESDR
jgi:hypothetical protein